MTPADRLKVILGGQPPALPKVNTTPNPSVWNALAKGGSISGLVVPGNIDLTKRPIVKNPDGSISTVRSMSFDRNGKSILIPTVNDGRVMSDEDSIKYYDKTGKHLGIFNSPETATDYAIKLHNDYEQGRIPGYPAVR